MESKIVLKDGKDMKETYIVSGHPRSGTSMMMHALITGGLEGAYSSEKVPRSNSNAVYAPNPNGFFELVNSEQQAPWHPVAFAGKVLKSIYAMLPQLAPGNYKVVYMLRNPEEIRASNNSLRKPVRRGPYSALSDDDYFSKMSHYISIAELRPDMDILQVWYHDVLANPVEQFERIRDFGLPIDPAKAASIVDPKLYRNRGKDELS
jgi:hypothetical protein